MRFKGRNVVIRRGKTKRRMTGGAGKKGWALRPHPRGLDGSVGLFGGDAGMFQDRSIVDFNGVVEFQCIAHEGTTTREDRKSTRLNSSHVKISYAVFCLKKKKTKQ